MSKLPLTRYRPATFGVPCLGGMFEDKEGGYVTYDEAAQIEKTLLDLVKAWEAIPAGRTRPEIIQGWLLTHMKPAIDKARKVLNRDPYQD